MSEAALNFSLPDDREELARAEVYGLLASLFYAPPSGELYEQLRVAVTEAPVPGAFLEASWSEVVAASRRLTLAQVGDEYTALFGGVGKPEVFLHGSWFIAGTLNEKPLVDLRGRQVDSATRELAEQVQTRLRAEQEKQLAERKREEHAKSATDVRAKERAQLQVGELKVSDLMRAQEWEVGVQIQRQTIWGCLLCLRLG